MMTLAIIEIIFLVFFIHLYIRGSGKDNRHECEKCQFRNMCMEGAKGNEEEKEDA